MTSYLYKHSIFFLNRSILELVTKTFEFKILLKKCCFFEYNNSKAFNEIITLCCKYIWNAKKHLVPTDHFYVYFCIETTKAQIRFKTAKNVKI